MSSMNAPGRNSLIGNTTGKNTVKTVGEILERTTVGAGSSPEKPNELSDREKKELQDRIKAMSHEELVAVVDAIPVSICLDRINSEIQKAAEIQASITRAYEMVKQ